MIAAFGLERGATLRERRVAVAGFARTGRDAARLLRALGAQVRILDAAGDEAALAEARTITDDVAFGRQDAADLDGCDLVVASPGVAPSSPWWTAAEASGIPWWSEIELAWRAGVRPLAAITGTNGKTTTTAMLAACLRAAGIDAHAAGNIGTTLASMRPGTPIVAEVSSFQLAATSAFAPPVAALLNVAPDHLDWHGSMPAYVEAKTTWLRRAAHVVVGASCRPLAETSGRLSVFDLDATGDGVDAGIDDGVIVIGDEPIVAVDALRRHEVPFRLNAIAAAALSRALGVAPAAIAAGLRAFEPDAHRMEPVAEVDGVRWVNDSKATDPHATEAALSSYAEPIILIAGGRNKGLDFGTLVKTGATIRLVLAIGEAAGELGRVFGDAGIEVESVERLEAAVEAAARVAEPGDVVLFSPACASFDQFRNYEHRGDAFKQAVAALGRSETR